MLKRLRTYLDRTKVLREVGSYDAMGLVYAVEAGNRECINILIAAGMDVNATNERGTPAINRAVEKENLPVIRLLIEAGANVNAADTRGRTPLMKAIESGNNHIFDFILEQEPELEQADELDETALFKAVREGNTTMTRKLIQAGSEIDLRNREGLTPLLLAVGHQRVGIVKALLQAGADPTATDAQGRTALDRNGGLSPRLIRMLRRAGLEQRRGEDAYTLPDFSALPPGGQNLAHLLPRLMGSFVHGLAQTFNMQDVVEEVEFKGREWLAQIDLPKDFKFPLNGNGQHREATPADENWVLEVLGHMRSIGAALQRLAHEGHGAHMYPPAALQKELLQVLQQYADYLKQQPPPPPRPVNGAAYSQAPNPARQAQLDHALHEAARLGAEDLVRTLIALGANVHAADASRQTPLHHAVPFAPVVACLLESGADPARRDLQGRTPIDLARQAGHLASLNHLDPHATV